MAEEITKIGGIRLKGGVSLGDFLSDEDKSQLGVGNTSLRRANADARRRTRLQAELKEFEDEMRRR